MPGHEVKITNIDEPSLLFHRDFPDKDTLTYALVEITPPIHLGPGFIRAVIGEKSRRVSMEEVLTNEEANVLLVSSMLESEIAHGHEDGDMGATFRRTIIGMVVERAQKLVDDPSCASVMARQNPFS